MKILAIESSCDETCAAVVQDGWSVHSNVVASQIDVHALTGGVVPEVASREHMKVMMPVVEEALREADCTWDEIDAIAVTKEPGLIGSLIVGRTTAAALAFAKDKPLIEVHHIRGHLYSNWLDRNPAEDPIEFPVLSLTVSGGHNELVLLKDHGDFEILGQTLDDAAGEAFDKTARLLGLGFPGGPAIEKRAAKGTVAAVDLPVPVMDGYKFSFSGLKTAVLYLMQDNEDKREDEQFISDVAATFQHVVVESLVRKLKKAAEEFDVKEVHLAGGVSANKALRARIQEVLPNAKFRHPVSMKYCTDNAAMIGAGAYFIPERLR